ncbi:MAG: hypothetical protein ACTHVE_05930 [Senegalia sp. (in: firmicutes)]|uniref:hypothetical protein n=2 Tax=Senegalia sp. (in: firmicutes) TaxID=1924098 RepID=UPI003F9904D3
MNELSPIEKRVKSLLDNPLLLILLIPILQKILKKEKNGALNLDLKSLSKINLSKVLDKVDILIKVAPYLPQDFISIINKYLPMYDRISKSFIVMDFFKRTSTVSPVVVANELNPKEKTNRVSYILKEELPQTEYKKISPYISIATNIDMYKGMLKVLSNLNSSENENDSFDNIIDLIGPLLAQSNKNSDSDNNKSKPDIGKLLGLLDILGDDEKESNE